MNRLASALLLMVPALTLSACVAGGDRRADLRAHFHEQVASCYSLPIAARDAEAIVLEVRVRPNGSLAQAPIVLRGDAKSPQAKAALAAVKRCVPFSIPADIAPRYAQWSVMRITFHTNKP